MVVFFFSERKRRVASFFIFDFTKGFHLFSLLKSSKGRHLKTLLCLAELGAMDFTGLAVPIKEEQGLVSQDLAEIRQFN